MKIFIKLSLFFFILNTFTGCSFFSKDKFKTHITVDSIVFNDDRKTHEFKCNQSSEDFTVVQNKDDKLKYVLVCKPTANGKEVSLKIYYQDKLVQLLDSVAIKAKTSGFAYGADSWITDMNSDGSLDLVQRSYSLKDPTKDNVRLSYWNDLKKSMIREDISKEDIKKYKSIFKVNKRG